MQSEKTARSHLSTRHDSQSNTTRTMAQLRYRPVGSTWNPTFLQARSLAGIMAICIAVCCPFISLGILLVSNNQSIESWPIQPAVYLAIMAAITNSALQVASTQALPIHWWQSAFRGATIKELERQWEVGNSIFSAIRHGRTWMTNASIASMAMALFIIDGPLLQRASTVGKGVQHSPVTLDMMLAPEVPTGFSGHYHLELSYSTPHALTVVGDWMNKVPILVDVTGCEGVCTGVVRGPGVAKINCTSTTWPITRKMFFDPNATWGSWKGVHANHQYEVYELPAFEVEIEPLHHPDKPGGAHLRVGTMEVFDLEGKYVESSCVLVPAILEYNISLQDQHVTVNAKESQVRVIDLANNTAGTQWDRKPNQIQEATLDTLMIYLQWSVASNTTMEFAVPSPPGYMWAYDGWSFNEIAAKHVNLSNGINDDNFRDPTPKIIEDFNDLMFRSGVATANWPNLTNLMDPGLSPKQTIRAHQQQQRNIFQSDLRWWAGAAAFDFLTILILIPLFNHWWNFDRSRSLSPFELALAFNSPLVKDVPANAGADGVVRQIGDLQVKFGVTGSGDRLRSEMDESQDAMSQQADSEHGSLGLRLTISRAEDVATPSSGMKFDI